MVIISKHSATCIIRCLISNYSKCRPTVILNWNANNFHLSNDLHTCNRYLESTHDNGLAAIIFFHERCFTDRYLVKCFTEIDTPLLQHAPQPSGSIVTCYYTVTTIINFCKFLSKKQFFDRNYCDEICNSLYCKYWLRRRLLPVLIP